MKKKIIYFVGIAVFVICVIAYFKPLSFSDIKMISIDGVAPTAENIKNGKYPVVTPIYAVTYEEETNENVGKLLDWILSDEGQYIIEETGYVGIHEGADYKE